MKEEKHLIPTARAGLIYILCISSSYVDCIRWSLEARRSGQRVKSGWVSGQEGLDACLFHSFVGLWLSSIRSPRSSAFITYSLHLTAEGERIRENGQGLASSFHFPLASLVFIPHHSHTLPPPGYHLQSVEGQGRRKTSPYTASFGLFCLFLSRFSTSGLFHSLKVIHKEKRKGIIKRQEY